MTIRRNKTVLAILVAVCGVAAADVMADGTYDLKFRIASGGGSISEGGGLQLSGSVGQPVVDSSFGDAHDLDSGFWYAVMAGLSAVGDGTPGLPVQNRLNDPFPNPFNPATTISFELGSRSPVRVRIFDAQGRLVRDLVQGEFPAGRHEIPWDGRNGQGGNVSSGVYFVRFDAAEVTGTKKMTLLK